MGRFNHIWRDTRCALGAQVAWAILLRKVVRCDDVVAGRVILLGKRVALGGSLSPVEIEMLRGIEGQGSTRAITIRDVAAMAVYAEDERGCSKHFVTEALGLGAGVTANEGVSEKAIFAAYREWVDRDIELHETRFFRWYAASPDTPSWAPTMYREAVQHLYRGASDGARSENNFRAFIEKHNVYFAGDGGLINRHGTPGEFPPDTNDHGTDHTYLFNRGGEQAVYVSQPYHLHPEARAVAEAYCDRYGFEYEVSEASESWWVPGGTLLVCYWRQPKTLAELAEKAEELGRRHEKQEDINNLAADAIKALLK